MSKSSDSNSELIARTNQQIISEALGDNKAILIKPADSFSLFINKERTNKFEIN